MQKMVLQKCIGFYEIKSENDNMHAMKYNLKGSRDLHTFTRSPRLSFKHKGEGKYKTENKSILGYRCLVHKFIP